jgi:hypothetical protein
LIGFFPGCEGAETVTTQSHWTSLPGELFAAPQVCQEMDVALRSDLVVSAIDQCVGDAERDGLCTISVFEEFRNITHMQVHLQFLGLFQLKDLTDIAFFRFQHSFWDELGWASANSTIGATLRIGGGPWMAADSVDLDQLLRRAACFP